MVVYTRLWSTVWCLVLAAAFALGLLVVPPAALVVWTILAAALGAWSTLFDAHPDDRAHRAVRRGCSAAAVAAAFACLIAAVGTLAWGVALLAAFTSPRLLTWVLARGTSGDPQKMSDSELREAWCASTQALRSAITTHRHWELVALRDRYLDEMELRNQSAMKAWMHSGHCADRQLETYLLRERAGE